MQDHELWLTAAQSLFAVAVLVNLRFGRLEAFLLFTLFAVQLVFEHTRFYMIFVYLALAIGAHLLHRKTLLPAMRSGLGIKPKSSD
jgi:cation:H+ antiporter